VRHFSFFLAMSVAVCLLVGCNGGNGGTRQSVETGTTSGSLRNVEIYPPSGAAYISRGTTFRISWVEGTTPPPSFEVELYRYKEPYDCDCSTEDTDCSDGSRETDGKGTELNRQGDSYVWDLDPNNDMDRGGVYFVYIKSGAEEYRATYLITTDDRAEEAAPAPKTVSTQGESAERHVVTP